MNPIRTFAQLIAKANKGQIASLTDIEKPVVPPFTTLDGQQISERQMERDAVFDAIAVTNQRRRDWLTKRRKKAQRQ